MDGKKYDAGKPRVDLLDDMPLAFLEVAKVLTFGAEKYEEGGWQNVPNGRKRYLAAAGRHRLGGMGLDDESGLHHEAHKICSALFAYELRLREEKNASNSIPDRSVHRDDSSGSGVPGGE